MLREGAWSVRKSSGKKLYWKFWEQIGTGRKKCAWRLCYAVQGDLKPYLQFYGTTALFPPLPLCCHAPEGAGVVPREPLCLQKSEMVQSSLTACLSCSEMEMAVLLPSTTLLWIKSQNQLCGAKFLVWPITVVWGPIFELCLRSMNARHQINTEKIQHLPCTWFSNSRLMQL